MPTSLVLDELGPVASSMPSTWSDILLTGTSSIISSIASAIEVKSWLLIPNTVDEGRRGGELLVLFWDEACPLSDPLLLLENLERLGLGLLGGGV